MSQTVVLSRLLLRHRPLISCFSLICLKAVNHFEAVPGQRAALSASVLKGRSKISGLSDEVFLQCQHLLYQAYITGLAVSIVV